MPMYFYLPQQPILNGIQAVTRAMLGLETLAFRTRKCRTMAAARARNQYENLAATGDRLLDALRMESDLTAEISNIQSPSEADLARWADRRRDVEVLVERYLHSISAWRQEVESQTDRTK